jgi:FkbM family methyltransferase
MPGRRRMHWTIRDLAGTTALRHVLVPLLRRVNPGDITIKHHWTGEPVLLHSFRHKGYWFHGKDREGDSMALCARLIRDGDVVFDVGGHIGYMASYFASLAGARGRVFSFEPASSNLPYIRVNAGRATHHNIVLVEKAVGASDGFATFWSEELTGQNGSMIPGYFLVAATAKSHGVCAQTREVTVAVVTLDSFARSVGCAPGFTKIDVEGAESLVLSGMGGILASARPRIMIEVTNEPEKVFEIFAAADYLLFDDKQRRVGHSGEFANRGPNLFAIPAEDSVALLNMHCHE